MKQAETPGNMPLLGNVNSARGHVRQLFDEARADATALLARLANIDMARVEDVIRKRGVGRRRAWDYIFREVGYPPLVAEESVAVWRWLKVCPLTVMPDSQAGRLGVEDNDVLEVNHLVIGATQTRYRLLAEYWSLSVTEHMLRRFFERGGSNVLDAVLEAHSIFCSLPVSLLEKILQEGNWALPSGPGALLVQPIITTQSLGLHLLARTWIHRDMLQSTQEAQVRASLGFAPDYLHGPLCPRVLSSS